MGKISKSALLLGLIGVSLLPVVAQEPSLEGKPAPEFSLKADDGKTIGLKQLKGSPVLINFYAEF